MNRKNNKMEFKRHLDLLGPRASYGLFAGRPELVNGLVWRVPVDSPHKERRWVRKEELIDTIQEYQSRDWTVWIALNEIEKNYMTVDHVRSVATLFFDIDAPRNKRALPATPEERMIAKLQSEKLLKYLKSMGAECFIACSGNGYHVYCPIPVVNLSSPKESWTFNNKMRVWMRQHRKSSGVNFDHTYNINRLVQPIGFPNKKIQEFPLPTFWLREFSLEDIEIARENNRPLLEGIQSIEYETINVTAQLREHPQFKELLRNDSWLRELYYGNWVKYDYPSRSEAELAIVRELVHWGFSDCEIYDIMGQCGIGKWQTAGESYHYHTIRKARLWEAKKGVV